MHEIHSLLQQVTSPQAQGRPELAETLLRQILSIDPKHSEACLELARIQIAGGRFDEAIGLLAPLANETHESAAVHRRLGLAQACAGNQKIALRHFERALELEPDDPQLLHVIANFQQALGLCDEAAASYRRALALKPLIVLPAAESPPQFRVLFLFAPGAGNTPFTYLVDRARFESSIVCVLKDFDYDIDRLRAHADVVVNLVSDVDQGRDILETVESLVERIGKPVINHPRSIAGTGRASVSTRLAGTPGCLIPETRMCSRADLHAALSLSDAAALSFPLLLRPAGTHGGENFDKMENRDHVSAFLNRLGAQTFYSTPFFDYRSRDRYFRKYRFIYVDDEILPYHLAIDGQWKVHHATTPMPAFPWMKDEERSFLEDPWLIFGPSQQAALQAIRDIVGLDYFGIDCSLTSDDALLVFEVNASMLVHDNNQHFPYRSKTVQRIKEAFHTLLERVARQSVCAAKLSNGQLPDSCLGDDILTTAHAPASPPEVLNNCFPATNQFPPLFVV
jgi:glutathione synthase/RimK-type ligase-like ATP-grasp enzyme